jgi:hypothetical protein
MDYAKALRNAKRSDGKWYPRMDADFGRGMHGGNLIRMQMGRTGGKYSSGGEIAGAEGQTDS